MASHKDPPESIDAFEKRKPAVPPPATKPRAARSDKGSPRMPPNAIDVIKKRQQWVADRLAKIEPEYQALKLEHERNSIALQALGGNSA